MRRHPIPHYHGDEARALFLIGALLLVIAASLGVALPLSPAGAVVAAIILAVAAGITSPAQVWIHFVNTALAALGALLFGIAAVHNFQSGIPFTDFSFAFIEVLALISLLALYSTTRTVRGLLLHPHLH